MTANAECRQELDRRATSLVVQKFLAVYYYRIRKRLAVPLPITGTSHQAHAVRAFSSKYPWAIWLLWALEDRILVLGEFVSYTSDAAAQTAVEADLLALARSQTFRESARPDLAYAHTVRILWVAATQWGWVNGTLRSALRAALQRAVDDAIPLSNKVHGQFDSLHALLATEQPQQHLHNITLIGTCALAMAAKAVAHPASHSLDTRVAMLFTAVLELRQNGFTEGVSYDGYVLSFVADWLSTVNAVEQKQVLTHPAFADLVAQVLVLAVPGDVMATAPLGDVEPLEMPFVWSALAKLQAFLPNARVAWALAQCDVSRLHSDALVALSRGSSLPQEEPSAHYPARLNYAVVLRTGYAADDVAVAVGLSSSPMGHIQCDNGSLVLGTRGRWWLDDPGYQQYLQTTERRFTVGPTAHNAPVINGHAQAYKQPGLIAAVRMTDAPDVQFALVDLTACYPTGASTRRVRRAIWLVGGEHLVVCDEIAALAPPSVAYHWHGHPSLYWCLVDGAATMVSDDAPDRWLHVFSPQIELSPADLQRLPGSRGQQTLALTLYPPKESAVWWVFSFAAQRPPFQMANRAFVVGGREVQIDERLLPLHPVQPLLRSAPLLEVTATREGNSVKSQCLASAQHFIGELEYAFYLMVNGKKTVVQWYTPSPEVSLVVPDDAGEQSLEVRGFVREKANPAKKLMRTAVVVSGFIRDTKELH